jgi:hypothetical protein
MCTVKPLSPTWSPQRCQDEDLGVLTCQVANGERSWSGSTKTSLQESDFSDPAATSSDCKEVSA